MRFFNTEGPNIEKDHYCLPPLVRWDLEEILTLIDQKKYFLLHAPRQTGKTTCLLALAEYLNRGGRYRAVYANLEPAQAARENVAMGMAAAVEQMARGARDQINDDQATALAAAILATSSPTTPLEEFLTRWCARSTQPTVLLLDEVDALIGDTLIALLRQVRAGYPKRPTHFPQTVILCGVRDLRDYRIHASAEKSVITGGSAFNIKAESLRLGDFNQAEVATLLQQHTAETGQAFTPEALDAVWILTLGQPWLVNALAYEACFRMREGRDRRQPITPAQMDQAKENLILRRVTHLDQLADKLREDRVRNWRFITPLTPPIPERQVGQKRNSATSAVAVNPGGKPAGWSRPGGLGQRSAARTGRRHPPGYRPSGCPSRHHRRPPPAPAARPRDRRWRRGPSWPMTAPLGR